MVVVLLSAKSDGFTLFRVTRVTLRLSVGSSPGITLGIVFKSFSGGVADDGTHIDFLIRRGNWFFVRGGGFSTFFVPCWEISFATFIHLAVATARRSLMSFRHVDLDLLGGCSRLVGGVLADQLFPNLRYGLAVIAYFFNGIVGLTDSRFSEVERS